MKRLTSSPTMKRSSVCSRWRDEHFDCAGATIHRQRNLLHDLGCITRGAKRGSHTWPSGMAFQFLSVWCFALPACQTERECISTGYSRRETQRQISKQVTIERKRQWMSGFNILVWHWLASPTCTHWGCFRVFERFSLWWVLLSLSNGQCSFF